jgi:hypothetical protein
VRAEKKHREWRDKGSTAKLNFTCNISSFNLLFF